jgi:hypothetical protein
MRIWPTKRGWKRFGLGLAILVAIALIANGFMAWRAEWRLRSRLAAIRAAGDPASIADLAPKPIPDAENAAAIIAKLGPRIDAFGKEQWHFIDQTPLGKDYDKRLERGEAPTAEELAAIRKIVEKYSDLATGLAAAAACEKYASVADFSVGYPKFVEDSLKKPSTIRDAARFLGCRMEILTAEGKNEKAIEQGMELLKLARLYDHEPLLINMLVAVALRGMAADPIYDALAAGPVSPETHAALDRELTHHDDPQRLYRVMKTERAFSIDAMKSMLNNPNLPGPPAWVSRMFGWPIKRFYIGALDYYDIELDSLKQPWTKGHGTVGRHQVPKEPTGYGPLADLLIPASQAAYDADARCIAQLRALRIFNALRQFAEKDGHEATKLEELGLPEDATIDPFDGKPLKLKHTGDGWVIYTVMTNGIDDGGDFKEMKDYGVAPRKWRLTE